MGILFRKPNLNEPDCYYRLFLLTLSLFMLKTLFSLFNQTYSHTLTIIALRYAVIIFPLQFFYIAVADSSRQVQLRPTTSKNRLQMLQLSVTQKMCSVQTPWQLSSFHSHAATVSCISVHSLHGTRCMWTNCMWRELWLLQDPAIDGPPSLPDWHDLDSHRAHKSLCSRADSQIVKRHSGRLKSLSLQWESFRVEGWH